MANPRGEATSSGELCSGVQLRGAYHIPEGSAAAATPEWSTGSKEVQSISNRGMQQVPVQC